MPRRVIASSPEASSGQLSTADAATARTTSARSRRKTPCVGICSTTYGDLVCRGCKRYAHEIIQWNAFSAKQRSTIWQRLAELRDGATEELVTVTARDRLAEECRSRGIPAEQIEKTSTASLAYELLCRSLSQPQSLVNAGVRLRDGLSPLDAVKSIDQAFLARSTAHYERAFKTPLV